jgi:hypothetical protein
MTLMRNVIVVAGVVACLMSGVATAQGQAPDTMEPLREKVRADKQRVVATAMDLTEAEAKAFWLVYHAYQRDMIAHYDRVEKLIKDYAAAYESMTDVTATRLLGEFVALEADHVAMLSKYVPRLQGVLPPRKVTRFYQVENKLRALLNYDLTRATPLLNEERTMRLITLTAGSARSPRWP